MSKAGLHAQASFVTPDARGQEASSEYKSLDDDDVERNADLYMFNHEVAQRCVNLAINKLCGGMVEMTLDLDLVLVSVTSS